MSSGRRKQLKELNLGATAVGTGLNAGDDYSRLAVSNLARALAVDLIPAANRFRVTQSMGDVVAYSGAMRRLAVELSKGGKRPAAAEQRPSRGPCGDCAAGGSTGIVDHAGKVNPSIPEMVNQVCYPGVRMRHDGVRRGRSRAARAQRDDAGYRVERAHASTILANAMTTLEILCVEGIQADEGRCRELLDRSTAVATALSPYLGYAKTAEIAKESVRTGKPIREIVLERGLFESAQLDEILSVEAMTEPGVPGKEKTK
jgi:aspartate ammonia-lyase